MFRYLEYRELPVVNGGREVRKSGGEAEPRRSTPRRPFFSESQQQSGGKGG
jgi:hypothetical protein